MVEAARHSHPFVASHDARERDGLFRDDGHLGTFDAELPPPPRSVPRTSFSLERLRMVRRLVAQRAEEARLDLARSQQLVLAVSELASNSVQHGEGAGTVRVWKENGTLLCEVQDEGRIEAPLAGRIKPRSDQLTGRGLWLVNQLCDLVQIRSFPTGALTLLAVDRALQLALVHPRASVHAQPARLLVELLARAPAGARFARAQAAAAPR